MKNTLQKTFGNEKRWVNYRLVKRDGKMTKVPYSPITKKQASSTESSDWSTYEEAIKANKNIGIVFTPEQNLLGIDIDHCLTGNEITHEDKQLIAQLIIEADTYTEISPSNTGLHLFLKLSAPLPLVANRHSNFECYTSGRYFTVTNNPYKEERDVRTVTPEEATALLSIIGYPWGKEEKVTSQQNIQASALDDETILKKMFKSKNGIKVKKLYDGDISDYKDDDSSADMALLLHFAFWTGRNAAQMESLWLDSPLGSREKTQKRQDYRNRSIKAAIDNCKEVYESKSQKIERQNPELDLLFVIIKGDKIFIQNTENICRILRQRDFLRYDFFRNTLEIKVADAWRMLEDHDTLNIQTEISILFPCFAKVGKEMVNDAITKVCRENTYDSATDWIKSLVWDKQSRLDTWLKLTYGVIDSEYYKKVGANWMKGLVKRIIHPGCKFDYVLVLEGEQGTKKSTSLGILGGSWHCETTMSTDNKDFFMQFQGKAIIEFSEGETLSKTEVKKMKAIITTQSDKYRPAYGRLSVDFPRRCVFAMTTNQEQYLKDETGNRRWLPVKCMGDANIEWLKENRDQLYAEAYNRVIVNNETTWEFPVEETLRQQNERRIHDPNAELVCDWFYNKLTSSQRAEGVTVHQAYRDAICGGYQNKPLDRWTEMSIADTFKSLLKLDKRRKMLDGVHSNRWFIMGTPEMMLTTEPAKDKLDELVEDLNPNKEKF